MSNRLQKWLWALLSTVCIFLIGEAHWLIGYELNIFVFYFVPISIVAWFIGLSASMGFALLSALVWFCTDSLAGNEYSSHFYAIWNTMVRLVSFIAIGWAVSKIRSALDLAKSTAEELRKALSEVQVLEAFLPICMHCKKIRNDESGTWDKFESYFKQHSKTVFSHGYCPECAKKLMDEAGLTDVSIEPNK